MATRRVPLIPPPHPALPDAQPRTGVVDNETVAPAKQLPSTYRGKSSGEFERVVTTGPRDTNALVAEAERWITKLTSDDNYRRLLQLAVLRRDAALLSGLLEAVRHRR